MSASSVAHFDSPTETIAWAREAINELQTIFQGFCNNNNFREFREIDDDAGEEVLKIKLISAFPREMRRKCTEAMERIRHSFDQSLYAACWAIGHRPKESIYFPWAQNPLDLERRLWDGKPKPSKIPIELWPILRRFEPYSRGNGYPGGNDIIRELAKIANRKHTINLSVTANVSSTTYDNIHIISATSFSIPSPRWDPVKNEVELMRLAGKIDPDYKYSVQFYVALNESPPLNLVPAIGVLNAFADKAQTVLDGLESEVQFILAG
jgi:hypothetical protein